MKAQSIRKIAAGFLAAVLAAGSLTGCGTANTSSKVEKENVQSANTQGESTEDESTQGASTKGESTEGEGSLEQDVTVIHAATSGMPSPYITTDDKNELDGYDIAVVKAVFDRLPQYELDLQVADFDAVMTGLTSGNYQLAVNNLGYREERAENYYYSYPYDKIKYVFIQRKDDEPLTSFQDAADRGYSIEVDAGNNITNALEAWNAENPDSQINLLYSGSDLAVKFQHIEEKTADFRVDDLPIYTAYQEEYGYENLDKHDISDEEAAKISSNLCSYFLLSKDEAGAALREDVNGALKELREDGTLSELSQKYFGADQVPDAEDFETTLN
jgi:polar amino acid transport system substrate-binding protein